jgi:hypothetical protein
MGQDRFSQLGGWIVADILSLEQIGRKSHYTPEERANIKALLEHLAEYTGKMLSWAENRGIKVK